VSVDRLFNVPVSISGPQQAARDSQNLESLKAVELAKEFESMLMLQMLRQMRQSMLDESDEQTGLSSATMTDMVDGELARQLSRTGGLGIAEAMMKAMNRQLGLPEATSQKVVGTTSEVAYYQAHTLSVAVASASVEAPVRALDAGIESHRLTSNYGWRSDPFTGATRYHGGIDLRAAYGQTVPAAAEGTVVEAGENGAYGLTLVVAHADGLRTRYAHLSTANVAVGDRVLQGQEIGRVGQSGRATGPHLHFEVIRDGQRIDPTTVMALEGSGLGGLKLAGADADFTVGGRAHTPAMSGDDDED
jgi:murein DD-endopeptidase MepM/ murein hydrolase activator NlpD